MDRLADRERERGNGTRYLGGKGCALDSPHRTVGGKLHRPHLPLHPGRLHFNGQQNLGRRDFVARTTNDDERRSGRQEETKGVHARSTAYFLTAPLDNAVVIQPAEGAEQEARWTESGEDRLDEIEAGKRRQEEPPRADEIIALQDKQLTIQADEGVNFHGWRRG